MCNCHHETCSQNCLQFHAKITASISLPDLHKQVTSAVPLPPSVKESGFFWSQEIYQTEASGVVPMVNAITVLPPG